MRAFGRLPSPARFTIAVGSGKGGVGKSTVSLNLALALAEGGAAIGLLDADVYGPNIPLMVGLTREKWQGDWEMAARDQPPIDPIERYGLTIMSAGFIIAEDQPLILDGQTVPFFLRQLVQRTAWGELEFLILDLPPGTADVQQALVRILSISGAIVVVTPQDAAHLDAKKAVQMFRQAGVPLLGGVENMSVLVCPHCGESIDVFPRVSASRSIWAAGVDQLGRIPLDPVIGQGGDVGLPIVIGQPRSSQAAAFRQVAERVRAALLR